MKIYRGNLVGESHFNPKRMGRFVKSEFRKPLAGEYFLSGARPEVYYTKNDLSTEYWVMVPYTDSLVENEVKRLKYVISEAVSNAIEGTQISKDMVLTAIDEYREAVAKL